MNDQRTTTQSHAAALAAEAASHLRIAVRAYTEEMHEEGETTAPPTKKRQRGNDPRWPRLVLIVDTETTAGALDPRNPADRHQALNFGSARLCLWRKDGTLVCLAEWVFYADDLPERYPEGYAILKAYCRGHWADVVPGRSAVLHLMSRTEFIDHVFWYYAGKKRAMVVAFNFPFDLSRLALTAGEARDTPQRKPSDDPSKSAIKQRTRRNPFMGGFSFRLWQWWDPKKGRYGDHPFRPRLGLKQIDPKRALKGYLRPLFGQDLDGEGEKPDRFSGHLLDLRTLVFALTDRSHALESACEAFGLSSEDRKGRVETHGLITPAYIDYNRQDVRATGKLLEKVREEYDRHPIDLQPTKAYSPASIAKAYLKKMGIDSPLERQPDFPREYLGYAMTAYFGGRAECRIRRTPVPVVYADFLSMYSTVNTNMALWRFLTAERIDIVDATDEVKRFLATITPERLFRPETWPHLTFFAEIEPEGDILPVRAPYTAKPGDALIGKVGDLNIGVNPLHSRTHLWYAGPDLMAAILLTGKVPKITRAFRIVPVGTQSGLVPVTLRNTITVDPERDVFFKRVIEERKRPSGEERQDRFLKVLANSGSYGIFAEMNRHELPRGKEQRVRIHALEETPTVKAIRTPEISGEFCFPPVAALITAGARLMLALLERCVTDLGGTYAFCDTDSMAIVATEDGGLVACPGGPHRLADGREAIRALSWAEVDAIVARFDQLHPYDRSIVKESVLEIEKENFDPLTGERRQLYCYAISAKRYALFNLDAPATPVLRKWSEHGLGHLLDPTKEPDFRELPPGDEERDGLVSRADKHNGRVWMRTIWDGIVHEAYALSFAWPAWLDRPALTRLTISSPGLLRPFKAMNAGRSYSAQMKPYNFLLTPHVARLGHPPGADKEHFQLYGQFETDASQWSKMEWIERYSGKAYRIATDWEECGPDMARVKSYRDVLEEYRFHPEPKSAAADGTPCTKQTRGLLQRRVVRAVGKPLLVGKESNKLEETDAGLVHDWDEVRNLYNDPEVGVWETEILPRLKGIPAKELAEAAGISVRAVKAIRNGREEPRERIRIALVRVTTMLTLD